MQMQLIIYVVQNVNFIFFSFSIHTHTYLKKVKDGGFKVPSGGKNKN